jgi:hypothetical protein
MPVAGPQLDLVLPSVASRPAVVAKTTLDRDRTLAWIFFVGAALLAALSLRHSSRV